jgi:hypothetical protein
VGSILDTPRLSTGSRGWLERVTASPVYTAADRFSWPGQPPPWATRTKKEARRRATTAGYPHVTENGGASLMGIHEVTLAVSVA